MSKTTGRVKMMYIEGLIRTLDIDNYGGKMSSPEYRSKINELAHLIGYGDCFYSPTSRINIDLNEFNLSLARVLASNDIQLLAEVHLVANGNAWPYVLTVISTPLIPAGDDINKAIAI